MGGVAGSIDPSDLRSAAFFSLYHYPSSSSSMAGTEPRMDPPSFGGSPQKSPIVSILFL